MTYLAKPFTLKELLDVVQQDLRSVIVQPFPAPPPPAYSAARPLRIIQVDDEPALLQTLQVIMRHRVKYLELLQFPNSVTAAHALARFDPDLLITDDIMPKLGGWDIVAQLAERHAAFPIMVISHWDTTEAWVRDFAGRALRISHITAPFNLADFLAQLASHVGPLDQ